jgi:BolA family transcriptional regulator, general stress-responsive regulator
MRKNEMALGPIGQILRDKLAAKLEPSYLEISDESNQHHGHSGAHPSGESHFRVRIASSAFAGLNRVAQHRLVNAAVAEELAGRVHALAIEIKAI